MVTDLIAVYVHGAKKSERAAQILKTLNMQISTQVSNIKISTSECFLHKNPLKLFLILKNAIIKLKISKTKWLIIMSWWSQNGWWNFSMWSYEGIIIGLGNELGKQNGTNILYLASWILNISSVNGLLPDGTVPSHYLNYSSIIIISQPWKQILLPKYNGFHSRKCIGKCPLQNDSHFVPTPRC